MKEGWIKCPCGILTNSKKAEVIPYEKYEFEFTKEEINEINSLSE